MPAPSIELLIEFTKDEDPRTRATAIAGLAKVGDPRGFAPVVVALFDPSDEVRITAATALGVFDDVRAYEPLAECLTDPCDQVGVNCAWALGKLSDTRCLRKLLEVVGSQDFPVSVRTAAATAVGERAEVEGSDLGTQDELIEETRSVLLGALSEEDGELRASSLWALGHLPAEPATVQACIAALQDPYEWSIRYAIEALAQFKDVAALEPLQALLSSEHEAIRNLAQQALELIG